MTTKIKLLIMTLLVIGANYITSAGFPETGTSWAILAITLAGALLTYIPKNMFLPSTSPAGTLSVMDFVGGLMIAVGTALSDWIATLATGTVFSLSDVLKLAGTVGVGYLLTVLRGGTVKK
jgi:hypothetical protein